MSGCLFWRRFLSSTVKLKRKKKKTVWALFFSFIEFVCVKGSKAYVTVTLRKQSKSCISPAHISAPCRMHRFICNIDVVLPPELRYSDRL